MKIINQIFFIHENSHKPFDQSLPSKESFGQNDSSIAVMNEKLIKNWKLLMSIEFLDYINLVFL
jgi:hypothetical protein